jgi:hypothetical protein
MASRIFDKFRGTLGKERVDIGGSFQPNGANVPVLNKKGNGWSAVHTLGGGDFVVTLEDSYVDYDWVWCKLQSPSVGIMVQLVAEPDVKTTKQLTFRVFDSSTKAAVTDPAFNANLRIHWCIRLKNTSGNY